MTVEVLHLWPMKNYRVFRVSKKNGAGFLLLGTPMFESGATPVDKILAFRIDKPHQTLYAITAN